MSTNLGQEVSNRSPITEAQLCEWLGAVRPGGRLCYHRGFLAIDCDPAASSLDAKHRAELRRLAKRASFAVKNGLAHLVQRRNGPADFSYLLVARRRSKSGRLSLGRLLAVSPTDPRSLEVKIVVAGIRRW